MKESELWKLVQHWVAIREKKNKCTFLEHIASLNEQNKKLRTKNLELFYEETKSWKDAIFFIIDPYFVKMYQGEVMENNGSLEIVNFISLKQIPCDSVIMPNVIGRIPNDEDAFDIIAHLTNNEAYILDDITEGNLNYYQEKDENGLYGRMLETTHFIKIGKPRKKTVSKEIPSITCSQLESLDGIKLIQNGEQIVPVLKNENSETYLIALDSMLDKKVEKVYQLL